MIVLFVFQNRRQITGLNRQNKSDYSYFDFDTDDGQKQLTDQHYDSLFMKTDMTKIQMKKYQKMMIDSTSKTAQWPTCVD